PIYDLEPPDNSSKLPLSGFSSFMEYFDGMGNSDSLGNDRSLLFQFERLNRHNWATWKKHFQNVILAKIIKISPTPNGSNQTTRLPNSFSNVCQVTKCPPPMCIEYSLVPLQRTARMVSIFLNPQ
ncbi:uncharacterized protein VP01_6917g1, partial [Puccinia sorghi]